MRTESAISRSAGLIRPATFVPETKRVAELLKDPESIYAKLYASWLEQTR